MVATRPEPRCQPKTDVMIARADIANGVITPVIAPVITPESQANVVTMPRPKGVFVASTIQVVFEVLNLARALITTVVHFAWVDTSYRRALTSVDYDYDDSNPSPFSARHLVFDWVACVLGLLLSSVLLHSTRPQSCIGCSCCKPTKFPAVPNSWLKVAALLTLQLTIRLLGLLVNVLSDCLNEAYWYSRAGLWEGPVECAPAWPLAYARGLMLLPPLLTLGFTLCAYRAAPRATPPLPEAIEVGMSAVRPRPAAQVDEGDEEDELYKAKATLRPPQPPRPRSNHGPAGCTAPMAVGVLVLLELLAVALTAVLLVNHLRPECECSEAAGAPVWQPAGCRMPSWAGEQEPTLVSTADGTAYDLYDSCAAVVSAIAKGKCPLKPSSYNYPQTYSKPWGRGGGIGRDLTDGPDADIMAMEAEDMMSAAMQSSNTGSSGSSGRRKSAPAAAPSSSSSGAPSFSKTNVQEQGVDEADIVRTDGLHVYVLHTVRPTPGASEAVLTIVRSFPAAEAAVVATVAVAATYGITPYDMFVDGNRLLVLGYHYDKNSGANDGRPLLTTRALLLDISDRAAPLALRAVEVEGEYLSSRKVDSYVYIVSESHVKPAGGVMPVARASMDAARLGGALLAPLGSCTAVGSVRLARGTELLTVWSIDMTAAGGVAAASGAAPAPFTSVLGRGRNVYASPTALYVASPTYWSGLGQQTAVLRFALSRGVASFHGVAVAPGFILNQWAMDEARRGASTAAATTTFRIATTIRDTSCFGCVAPGPVGNHLFTYDVTSASAGAPYETRGSLTGLAPGETIYSVRFLADRAYMVTFRQASCLQAPAFPRAPAPHTLPPCPLPLPRALSRVDPNPHPT